MSDAAVRDSSPPELSGLPSDFWDSAELVEPVRKQAVSLRIDEDVLDWFRQSGPRYQSRMNAVLRSYMNARSRGRARGVAKSSKTVDRATSDLESAVKARGFGLLPK